MATQGGRGGLSGFRAEESGLPGSTKKRKRTDDTRVGAASVIGLLLDAKQDDKQSTTAQSMRPSPTCHSQTSHSAATFSPSLFFQSPKVAATLGGLAAMDLDLTPACTPPRSQTRELSRSAVISPKVAVSNTAHLTPLGDPALSRSAPGPRPLIPTVVPPCNSILDSLRHGE